jgi:hypothetical protein
MDSTIQGDDGFVFPPTPEQIQDMREHHVGQAIRLASRLGRPLEAWEWELFRKAPASHAVYEVVQLPNGSLGVTATA